MNHVVSVSKFLWLNHYRYHAGIKKIKNTTTHSCEIPGIGGWGGLCSRYIYIYYTLYVYRLYHQSFSLNMLFVFLSAAVDTVDAIKRHEQLLK